jgi:hypothetical protein
MDLKRLTEWLMTAEGLGKALISLLGVLPTLWAATTKALDDWVKAWGLPVWVPNALAAAVVTLFAVMLWHSYRRFARASRLEKPDAFVLRPTGPSDLIGREGDLTDLLKSVKAYRVVLLDGESGCGKSALAGAGLVPTLQAQGTGLLPVLVRDWGDDWFAGPPAAVLGALWQALSHTERERLSWTQEPDLAAATEALQAELVQRLSAIFSTLGRRPLLILDQFDDHQARHRARFVDSDGNWLRPQELIAGNPFWATLTQALRQDRLHLLVITRNDTAAGLACIDLLPKRTARRTLHRVENLYLPQVLTQLAPDSAQPPIVSHPERGWQQLRQQLHTDMQTEGALLMQQLRTVLQGLRELPALTLRDYRRAGGLRGLEALFVSRALRRAAESARNAHGLPLAQARALLRALTQSGNANQAPKARRQDRAELNALADNPAQAEQLLQRLAHENLIRPADTTGQHHAAWQLDHDYLAKAVLAEARLANRWQVTLEEGHARYRQASHSTAEQWATLLPTGTQARLWWEHLHGRLPWHAAQDYVRRSLLKPLTTTLALAVLASSCTWAYQDQQLSQEADRLINRLAHDKGAVMDIWRASPSLRDRVRAHILADPNLLLTAVQADWPLADIAVDPQRTLAMVQALRNRMDAEQGSDRVTAWASGYASVASRLTDQAKLLVAAQALRTHMDAEQDSFSARQWASSYASVASRLTDQAKLLEEARALRTRMDAEEDSDLVTVWASSYASVASRLTDQAKLLEAAQALRTHMDAEQDSFRARQWASSYASVASRLTDQAKLLEAAQALRTRMDAEQGSRARQWASSYASVASRLTDQATLLEVAQALRTRMDAEQNSPLDRVWASSYASVASRLTDQKAHLDAAQALRTRMDAEQDSDLVSEWVSSYASVAQRIAAQRAQDPAALAREVLTMAGHPFLEWPVQTTEDDTADTQDSATNLLQVMETLAQRTFTNGIPEAVAWAQATHGIKPESLRPHPLPNSAP